MAGQLKIGGNIIATHAGSEGAGAVTLDSSTLTIGSNTTVQGAMNAGSITSGVTFPDGHILQVVHDKLSSNFSSTTAGSWLDVGQKATITPSSTSSKILIIAEAGAMYNSATGYNTQWGIFQPVANDIANIIHGSDYIYNNQGPFANNQAQGSYTINFLDSPSSTSALTYGVMIKGEGSGTSRTMYYNQGASSVRFYLGITLMEIKG